MLTRTLALKLLAPTVLVSLALVGACLVGVLYLNSLHVDVAKELQENVESTVAAARLEATTQDLLKLLQPDHGQEEDWARQVGVLNQKAREAFDEVRTHADRPREIDLVAQLDEALEHYFAKWDNRTQEPKARLPQYDKELADHLQGNVQGLCVDLRKYNTTEVAASDRENRQIVHRLTWVLLAVGLGAPLSGLLLGYAVARSLHRSIYQLSVRLRDAAGHLRGGSYGREGAAERKPGSTGNGPDFLITLDEQSDLPELHRQMQGVLEEIGRVVEQLQQREREVLRAEQLAAVGQVAAGVAHELRNPLTSVKMLVQTGLEGNGKPAAGLPPEDLAIIEHEVRRMEQCIQTFLDFARPPRSERRRSDLVAVLQRALLLVEGRMRRQKVSLDAELPSAPLFLDIDPEQIHQVVVNLLLNALDAMPRGGTLRVSLGRKEGTVKVQVRDTGAGIAPRIRERLFEPFVSSKETGLGLGLSICKRLIEAHGGTIRGENQRGGGAVFTFTLPG
jgi:two-component system, NtrC family, sensor histidine kinase HydH